MSREKELEAALRDLVKDEWRVSCDWGDANERHEILARARAALDASPDKCIATLEKQIAQIDEEFSSLQKRRDSARRELEQLRSRAYIAKHKIQLKDVQLSHGSDMPWFGHVADFISWMRVEKVDKRWAEWNGLIYNTKDLLQRLLVPTPARIDDLAQDNA